MTPGASGPRSSGLAEGPEDPVSQPASPPAAPRGREAHEALGAALRRHRRVRALTRRLTAPARRRALPVLRGHGRGLRVRFGASALIGVLSDVEAEVEGAFLGLLRPGDVVYDVGANIGWYSLLAARAVGPAGAVVAFEPSVANAACVRENALRNGFEHVTTIPAAVTDQSGWATFLDKGSLEGRLSKDDSPAQARRRAALDNRYRRASVVPVLALDAWIAETGQRPPDVLKIDVEGAEAGVLRGMTHTLRTARPSLVIELHGTRAEVADALDEVGYEQVVIESDVPVRQAPWWAHVLARAQDPGPEDGARHVGGGPEDGACHDG